MDFLSKLMGVNKESDVCRRVTTELDIRDNSDAEAKAK
jgi:hypothetical protein